MPDRTDRTTTRRDLFRLAGRGAALAALAAVSALVLRGKTKLPCAEGCGQCASLPGCTLAQAREAREARRRAES